MTSRFRRKPSPNPLKIGKVTVFQFASNTSIHGIAYVFDKNIQKCDRLLWIILVCFGAGLALHMSHQAWTNWKSSPVLTSVGSTALPLSHVDYPAITICSQGRYHIQVFVISSLSILDHKYSL